MCTVTDRVLLGTLACFCSHVVAACHLLRTQSGRSPGAGNGTPLQYSWASPVAQTVKNPPAMQRPRFNPWVRKIPWSREWQPTPVFLPGESAWTEEPGGATVYGVSKSQT